MHPSQQCALRRGGIAALTTAKALSSPTVFTAPHPHTQPSPVLEEPPWMFSYPTPAEPSARFGFTRQEHESCEKNFPCTAVVTPSSQPPMDTASLGLTWGPSSVCSAAALPPSCPRTWCCCGGSAGGAAQPLYQHTQLWEGSCGFLSSQTRLLSFSRALTLTALPHHSLLGEVSTRDQLHHFLLLHSEGRRATPRRRPCIFPPAPQLHLFTSQEKGPVHKCLPWHALGFET